MPTLEQRADETPQELEMRLDNRTREMGISHGFARYLEDMEIYLLELERRVQRLEAENRELKNR